MFSSEPAIPSATSCSFVLERQADIDSLERVPETHRLRFMDCSVDQETEVGHYVLLYQLTAPDWTGDLSRDDAAVRRTDPLTLASGL